MTQPSPPIVPTTSAIDYKPLSGWAVAGFLLGMVFAVAVVGSGIFSVIRGEPFFPPGWLYACALAAVAFSLVGQWQIRNSEGTRAGATLAKWGLWLSILSGLGYFAYIRFTELALSQQANDFLMTKAPDQGFFPRLQDGSPEQANYAFLLTKSPAMRSSARPENLNAMELRFDIPSKEGMPGELTNFRKSFLTQVFRGGGENCKVEPLGLKDWQWDQGGYRVERNYRVSSPETILEILVPVRSMTIKGQRKWFVVHDEIQLKSQKATSLGEQQMNLRFAAMGKFPTYFGYESKAKAEKIPIIIQNNRMNIGQEDLSKVRDSLRRSFYSKTQESLQDFKPVQKSIEPIRKADGQVEVKIGFEAVAVLNHKLQQIIRLDGDLILTAAEDEAMSPEAWRPSRVELHWLFPVDMSKGSSDRD